MAEKLILRFGTLLFLTSLLALSSCGGGGGGSSLPSPLVYGGNTSPAIITATNASKLAANVMGSDDTATTVLGVSVVRDDTIQNQSNGLIDITQRLNHNFRDIAVLAAQASSAQRAVAAVIVDDTEPCDGGNGSTHTSGTLNDNDLTGTLEMIFDHCLIDGITVNGPVTIQVEAFDSVFGPTNFTINFVRLTLRGPGISIDAGGSLRTRSNIGSNTETLTENLVFVDNNTGEMGKIENFVIESVYVNNQFPITSIANISGRIFDQIHGYVDVVTLDPLGFSAPFQLFPNPGQLKLTGATNQSIQVTAVSNDKVMLELDLDGDIIYESWTTVLWTDISGTTVIDFVRPTAPVVSVNVDSDRAVTISWSPSNDSNGISEYRVRRGTMPIGRTTSTSFTDRSAEPGITADYYVRAVDNVGNVSDLIPPQSVKIPSSGTTTFASPISGTLPFASNTSGVGIGVADVNGDGSRDLVVSGGDANQIATALGPLTAGMSFTASPTDFGTMNNDSNLPFFQLANITGSNLPEALGAGRTLVWNTTNNVWEDSAGSNQSFQFEARAYIDLDDDGILDIVKVTWSSDFIQSLSGTLGNGNGSYDGSSTRELAGIKNFAWGGIGAIVATDSDRDGLTDLIVWDTDMIRIVRQTRRGLFSVVSSLPAISNSFHQTAFVADVTGDGYPEIMYADYAIDNVLRVFVNDGAGNFESTPIASGVSEPWNFTAGDLNGDGIQDLVVGNRLTNALDLYISQGNGTFTLLSSINGVGFPFITLSDIDLDGDVDVVTAGSLFQSTDVNIYLNQ